MDGQPVNHYMRRKMKPSKALECTVKSIRLGGNFTALNMIGPYRYSRQRNLDKIERLRSVLMTLTYDDCDFEPVLDELKRLAWEVKENDAGRDTSDWGKPMSESESAAVRLTPEQCAQRDADEAERKAKIRAEWEAKAQAKDE